MTGNDPLAAALSGIDNAERVGHLTHEVEPASNEIGSVLEVFYDRGYGADLVRGGLDLVRQMADALGVVDAGQRGGQWIVTCH